VRGYGRGCRGGRPRRRLDHRLGPHFLRAGIGYGGSCFPKDTSALKQLAANSGYHFQLLTAVIEVNELQKRRVVGSS
jgi:UDPglucose 6-dehydrogenase